MGLDLRFPQERSLFFSFMRSNQPALRLATQPQEFCFSVLNLPLYLVIGPQGILAGEPHAPVISIPKHTPEPQIEIRQSES